jgi:serine/threonine protein kinase
MDDVEEDSDDSGWLNVTEKMLSSGSDAKTNTTVLTTGQYEVTIPVTHVGKHLVEVRVNSGDGLKQIAVSPVQLQVVADPESAQLQTEDSGVLIGGVLGGFVFLLLIGLGAHHYHLRQVKMKAFDFVELLITMTGNGELSRANSIVSSVSRFGDRKSSDSVDNNDDAGSDRTFSNSIVSGVSFRDRQVREAVRRISHAWDTPRIPREIKRSHVTMLTKLGVGAFGEVWKAFLDESSSGGVPGYMVAVKTCLVTGGEGEEDMVKEATVMAQVPSHPNVVPLIGVVTRGTPLFLLVSICENGSVLSFLSTRKTDQIHRQLTILDKINMSLDVAKGMAHLAECHFVHRDLAARNVLVNSMVVCQVADFGLSRAVAAKPEADGEEGKEEEYYRSKKGQFAVRWTAPEAMETNKFSMHSDVWSFGVVMCEIFSDGKRPYNDLNNASVMNTVLKGETDKRPLNCPRNVFASIIMPCWAQTPEERPSFSALVELLDATEPDFVRWFALRQQDFLCDMREELYQGACLLPGLRSSISIGLLSIRAHACCRG